MNSNSFNSNELFLIFHIHDNDDLCLILDKYVLE